MSVWRTYIQFILSRPLFFYLICIIGISFMIKFPLFRKNSVDQTMNRLTPPIDYFKEFVDPHKHFDEFKLHQCVDYHQKVVEFYDFERSGAYAMMGFCEGLLGETNKATTAFKSSTDINPNNFWPYYDIGILNYQKGNYAEAIKYFQIALTKEIKLNVLVLFSSKVYADVRLSDPRGAEYNFLEALKEGRLNAYIFLMESLAKRQQYEQLFEVALLGLKEKAGHEDVFYYYAGRSAFYQQAYNKAIDLLQIAVQKNPQNTDALLYLAMCLRMAGKEDAAQKLFETAKEIYQQEGSFIEKALNSPIRFF